MPGFRPFLDPVLVPSAKQQHHQSSMQLFKQNGGGGTDASVTASGGAVVQSGSSPEFGTPSTAPATHMISPQMLPMWASPNMHPANPPYMTYQLVPVPVMSMPPQAHSFLTPPQQQQQQTDYLPNDSPRSPELSGSPVGSVAVPCPRRVAHVPLLNPVNVMPSSNTQIGSPSSQGSQNGFHHSPQNSSFARSPRRTTAKSPTSSASLSSGHHVPMHIPMMPSAATCSPSGGSYVLSCRDHPLDPDDEIPQGELVFQKTYSNAGPYKCIRIWYDSIGRRFYDCSCGKKQPLRSLTSMKHHAHWHSQDEHKCNECGRMFSHHWSLNAHMKVHKRKAAKLDENSMPPVMIDEEDMVHSLPVS